MKKTVVLKARFPEELAAVIERGADRLMITKSTYLRMVVAHALGYMDGDDPECPTLDKGLCKNGG